MSHEERSADELCEMRPQDMNLGEALLDLRRNGSEDDPIEYRGEETTPTQLEWKLGPLASARSTRISYSASRRGRLTHIRNGTLSGMVRDRRA